MDISAKKSVADYICEMPKAELHVHLEGSVQPQTLLELAQRNHIDVPCTTVADVQALYRYQNFRQFAEVIIMTGRCLRHPEDFAMVVERMAADLAAQQVRYAEIFWTPQLYEHHDLPLPMILAGLHAGRTVAEDRWSIQLRWIPDLVRSLPPPSNEVMSMLTGDMARAAGVVALGLGGPEAGYPPEKFVDVFRTARKVGLPANPHAGEMAGPKSIWGALHTLKAMRIGHGVRAVEDPTLVHHLAEHGIPMEVCPTSNLCLGVVASYAAHPLRTLFEAGCQVTINSDDPPMFATTLTAEYLHAIEDCGLTLDQLELVAKNAVTASYLPQNEKAAMLKLFVIESAQLRCSMGLPALGVAKN